MEVVLESLSSITYESNLMGIVLEGETPEDNPSKIKELFTRLKDAVVRFWNDYIIPKIKAFAKKMVDLKDGLTTKIKINSKKVPILKNIIARFESKTKDIVNNVEDEYATTLVTSAGYITNVKKSALEAMLTTTGDDSLYIERYESDMLVDPTLDTDENMQEDKGFFKSMIDSLGKIFTWAMQKILKGKEKCVNFLKNDVKDNKVMGFMTGAINFILSLVSRAVTIIIQGVNIIVQASGSAIRKIEV